MGEWMVLLFAISKKYDKVLYTPHNGLSPSLNNCHLHEISFFFLCVVDIRWNNSHEVIAWSYCDETLPNSRRQTVNGQKYVSLELPFHNLLKNATFRHWTGIGKTLSWLEVTIMDFALIVQWNVSPFAILNQFQIFVVVIISEGCGI